MLLEKISEKNNLITVSHYNEISEKLEEGRYNTKSEQDIFWKFNEEMAGPVWMTINFIEPTEVYEIDYKVEYIAGTSTYDSSVITHSLDGVNWYEYENGKKDLFPKFIKIQFDGVQPGFCLNKLRIHGDEKYEMGKQLISLSSKRYYPQRFFENAPTIPKMIHCYLEMLESNKYHKTIERFFKNDTCTIEVFLIFDEGDEGSGAINSYPINTVPINTGSATTYDGLGAVIINRIAGGGAFYNLTGRITDPLGNFSSIGLRFNATVDCEESSNCINEGGHDMNDQTHGPNSAYENACKKQDEIQYRWEFDDPFANNVSGNPTTLSVPSYGEVIHSYSMLGYYNVRFVMEIDGVSVMGNQFVEITPSPYVITGDYYAIDGTIYTISGLTAWPDQNYDLPIVVLRDINNTPSVAELVDNGNRTFSIISNGETEPCRIRIYDKFYDEYRLLNMTFEDEVPANALLDHDMAPIYDDDREFILTNS